MKKSSKRMVRLKEEAEDVREIVIKDEPSDELISVPLSFFLKNRCLKKEVSSKSEDEVDCPCEECTGRFWVPGEGAHEVKVKFEEAEREMPADNVASFASESEADQLEGGQPNPSSEGSSRTSGSSSVRRYSCASCPAAYRFQSELKRHARRHSGERPYSCRFCGQAYAHSSNCKAHEQSHNGERPFLCRFCEKAFTYSFNCTAHERIHTGERPYTCATCGAAFAQAGTLAKHQQTHSGVKAYKCPVCGTDFTTKASCKRHQEQHDPERVRYPCSLCKKTFASKQNLKIHTQRHS